MALAAAVGRDKDIVPPGNKEAAGNDDESNVADGETENVQWILAELVEGAVAEAVDDGESGSGDVAEERSPEHRDLPILALANDLVQVAVELVALFKSC